MTSQPFLAREASAPGTAGICERERVRDFMEKSVKIENGDEQMTRKITSAQGQTLGANFSVNCGCMYTRTNS